MAITGKKINELDSLINLTDDSVLPIVIVDSGVAETTAKKVTVGQLATYFGDFDPTNIEGYDASAVQKLINDQGTLKWVTDTASIATSYYYEYPSWILSLDGQDLTVIDTSNSPKVYVYKNGLKLRQDTNSSSEDHDYWLNGTTIHFNISLEATDVINLEVF